MENNDILLDKDELLVLVDEPMCQYSGLPSVSSYIMEEDVNFVMGHS